MFRVIAKDNFNKWAGGNFAYTNENLTVKANGSAIISSKVFKKSYFLIEIEFFCSSSINFNVGFDGKNAYYVQQRLDNTKIILNVNNAFTEYKAFGKSVFNESKTWHSLKFERKGKNGTITFDNYFVYDAPSNDYDVNFHAHKFYSDEITVRNFKITIIKAFSCNMKGYHSNKCFVMILILSENVRS